MDLGSILVIIALLIFVVGFVIRPILEKQGFSDTEKSRHISALQAERDQIIMVLQELDMDHAMGKIPTEDYQAQRPGLVTRGAAILKELDQLGEALSIRVHEPVKSNGQERRDLDARIEDEILHRRKTSGVETVGFCTQCGNRIHVGDHFCSSCGAKVQVEGTEA